MNKLKKIWRKFFPKKPYSDYKPNKEIMNSYAKKTINPAYYGTIQIDEIDTSSVKDSSDQPGAIYAPYKLGPTFESHEEYKKFMAKNKDKIVKFEDIKFKL